jgi:hypothetical protein
MSVAFEGHVGGGLRRAQTTTKVQVPLEERTRASTVDVQVQSEGKLLRSVDSPNVHFRHNQ